MDFCNEHRIAYEMLPFTIFMNSFVSDSFLSNRNGFAHMGKWSLLNKIKISCEFLSTKEPARLAEEYFEITWNDN